MPAHEDDEGLYSSKPQQPAPRRGQEDDERFEEAAPLPKLGRRGREDDDDDRGEPRLKSLAQSARTGQLTSARWTLISVGALTMLVNFVFMFVEHEQLNNEMRKQGVAQVPPEVELIFFAIYGGIFLLAIAFIVLGILVYRYPLVCTVTGLVLFLLGMGLQLLANPMMLAQGAIVKIIIVVLLAKAIQAASAYERERHMEPALD